MAEGALMMARPDISARQTGGRGEPTAALRHPVISTHIMGSPARRLSNPITRCWAQLQHRYAGTDNGRGTDQTLDRNRNWVMSAFLPLALIDSSLALAVARRQPDGRWRQGCLTLGVRVA